MTNLLLALLSSTAIAGSTLVNGYVASNHTLSAHTISLEKRYDNKFVNDVFKENILLNLAYLDKRVKNRQDINWSEINKPNIFEFGLKPQETFSFHDRVSENYKEIKLTTNAHFNAKDGFKTDGYLFGDGVCHLASLFYWVARDAELKTEAPTNHNFMPIPEIPKEYGVSVYYPDARQNLYITNNKDREITFKIAYNGADLTTEVLEKE